MIRWEELTERGHEEVIKLMQNGEIPNGFSFDEYFEKWKKKKKKSEC